MDAPRPEALGPWAPGHLPAFPWMRRPKPSAMRRALTLALLLALPGGAAGGGEHHVAFVETRAVHELEGALEPGASQAFRFPVRDENVTRVAVRLRWDAAAGVAFSLAALDPFGRAPAPSVAGAGGDLRLDSGEVAPLPDTLVVPPGGLADALAAAASRAGRGEWRFVVRTEDGAGAAVPYALEVEVSRYEAVTLSPVTLKGAPRPDGWALALPVLASAALGLGVALACSRKVAHSVVPPGDKAPSPTAEPGRCASER